MWLRRRKRQGERPLGLSLTTSWRWWTLPFSFQVRGVRGFATEPEDEGAYMYPRMSGEMDDPLFGTEETVPYQRSRDAPERMHSEEDDAWRPAVTPQPATDPRRLLLQRKQRADNLLPNKPNVSQKFITRRQSLARAIFTGELDDDEVLAERFQFAKGEAAQSALDKRTANFPSHAMHGDEIVGESSDSKLKNPYVTPFKGALDLTRMPEFPMAGDREPNFVPPMNIAGTGTLKPGGQLERVFMEGATGKLFRVPDANDPRGRFFWKWWVSFLVCAVVIKELVIGPLTAESRYRHYERSQKKLFMEYEIWSEINAQAQDAAELEFALGRHKDARTAGRMEERHEGDAVREWMREEEKALREPPRLKDLDETEETAVQQMNGERLSNEQLFEEGGGGGGGGGQGVKGDAVRSARDLGESSDSRAMDMFGDDSVDKAKYAKMRRQYLESMPDVHDWMRRLDEKYGYSIHEYHAAKVAHTTGVGRPVVDFTTPSMRGRKVPGGTLEDSGVGPFQAPEAKEEVPPEAVSGSTRVQDESGFTVDTNSTLNVLDKAALQEAVEEERVVSGTKKASYRSPVPRAPRGEEVVPGPHPADRFTAEYMSVHGDAVNEDVARVLQRWRRLRGLPAEDEDQDVAMFRRYGNPNERFKPLRGVDSPDFKEEDMKTSASQSPSMLGQVVAGVGVLGAAAMGHSNSQVSTSLPGSAKQSYGAEGRRSHTFFTAPAPSLSETVRACGGSALYNSLRLLWNVANTMPVEGQASLLERAKKLRVTMQKQSPRALGGVQDKAAQAARAELKLRTKQEVKQEIEQAKEDDRHAELAIAAHKFEQKQKQKETRQRHS